MCVLLCVCVSVSVTQFMCGMLVGIHTVSLLFA